MKELYKNYLRDARALDKRVQELRGEMKLVQDIDTLKQLRRRIEMLEEEHGELLRDMRDMEKYLDVIPAGGDTDQNEKIVV
ncbi:MAG: hypothetical protein QM689_05200 [Oscillospiraceae bacterium]